ncbi:hypothetical protein FSP39_010281 [Pinctada imbricata]|uniref:G-protein coupled receptors family 1 profile domain-containing protein n=1 Tax=Pinctada imbricata TaxID=66713 RepID=A0AA88XN69_PINIB|nr:hypothetical protein FSP39_010281 [Pinctada imbricata]
MENITITSEVSTVFMDYTSTSTDKHDHVELFKTASTSTLLFFVFLSSVAGNLLVFLVFYKRRILLTISNRFILNLSVCNSLNTLLVMPFMFAAMLTENWIFGQTWCQLTGFLMNTIFAASTLTLVAISIDRYCAVVTPLHYTMRVTSKRCLYMIVTVWTLAVSASLPPLFGWNAYEYQEDKRTCTVLWMGHHQSDRYYTLILVCLTFVVPLIVILWAYIVIFRAARNNSERTRRNSVITTNQIDDNTQTPLRNSRRRSSTAPILIRRLSSASRTGPLLWHRDEWKTALTSLLVVSTFVICWLPYFIIIVLESVLDDPECIYPVIETLSIILAMSSCACNPLVYVFRSKVARQELKGIIRMQSKEETNFPSSRRGSSCALARDGIIRQGSTESDIILPEKPLHLSSTATTLTSMVSDTNVHSLRS